MKTRRGLLLGLGILASLSMTVPAAAANVDQAVVSSVEGQQDQTTEEDLPPEEGNEGEDGTEAPEAEQKPPYFNKEENFQLYVWNAEQKGYLPSQATGAFYIEEKVFYLKNGCAQSGIVEIEQAQNAGELTPAAQLEVGKKYFFAEAEKEPGEYGALVSNDTGANQWKQSAAGAWVCITPGGVVAQDVNGWQEVVKDRWIFFDKEGNAAEKSGWQKINENWYYLDESGKRDTSKTGMQTIGNEKYFLNADGKIQTGFQNANGQTYYFGKNGILQKYTGWQTVDGKLYYFNGAYQLANSGAKDWQQIGGKWYWMENGKTAFGWRSIKGKWYYLDEKTGIMQTGFFKDTSGNLYHSNGSGAMTGGGWNRIGNTWYWMHNNGVVYRGWLKLGNTWYYLDENTGAMKTGWYQVKGTWYYSNASGAMQTGWIKPGNSWYYLSGSGAMQEGWIRLGNTWYYLTPGNGAMKTGWYQVKGTWYYSNASGAMQTGWIKPGNSWYYLSGSGAMQEGWIRLGNTWYYLTPGNGAMKTGWYQVDGKWYYSNGSGAMAANRWIDTYYYVGASGAMATNTWVGSYWVGADGRWRPNYDPDLTGAKWVQKDSKWYFQREDGTCLQNMWKKINGSWYWFEKDGVMATGWKRINGLKYYFDASGKMLQDLDGIIGKQSSYRITINRVKCQIMVYAKSETGQYDMPVKTFVCSVGLPNTPTPTGTFHTVVKAGKPETEGVVELMGPSWGKWGTMITPVGGIWFHSVACSSTDPTYSLPAGQYNKLGAPASHGCVRLTVRDAKWIYMNCGLGTEVTISDTIGTPFDKPASIKIPASQKWDPTDPAI